MRISNGRYLVDGLEKIVHLSDMNKQTYKKRFKGKLYCPTEGCPALLSYSGGKKAHFKTWRLRHHSTDCMYNVNRNMLELGAALAEDATITISRNRRQNALRDAAKMFEETVEEHKAIKEARLSRKGSNQPAKQARKKYRQMTLYDGDLLEDDSYVKGKAIRKRFVNELTFKDVGQVRLVLGYVRSIVLVGSVADVMIQYNEQLLKVTYPEAFVKERLNSSYLNKFSAIDQALESGQTLTFIGIGDIGLDKEQEMELVIYSGADFKINQMDLSLFAKQYID
ncbi:hypothetical protein AAGS61_14610 [Lysinibacillus sp. KU-BSD001]|uniref:hypothetical protein n=1 Tax=Lysinibacillus sp. KU-BSD001 TaxID=3141328 RepID=UPI0036E9B427